VTGVYSSIADDKTAQTQGYKKQTNGSSAASRVPSVAIGSTYFNSGIARRLGRRDRRRRGGAPPELGALRLYSKSAGRWPCPDGAPRSAGRLARQRLRKVHSAMALAAPQEHLAATTVDQADLRPRFRPQVRRCRAILAEGLAHNSHVGFSRPRAKPALAVLEHLPSPIGLGVVPVAVHNREPAFGRTFLISVSATGSAASRLVLAPRSPPRRRRGRS